MALPVPMTPTSPVYELDMALEAITAELLEAEQSMTSLEARLDSICSRQEANDCQPSEMPPKTKTAFAQAMLMRSLGIRSLKNRLDGLMARLEAPAGVGRHDDQGRCTFKGFVQFNTPEHPKGEP